MNAANEERGLFVVVLDDEREQGEAFERAIGEALQGVDVEVERWKPNERDVDELEERERNFREYGFWRIEGQLVIDRADVLVVDWDLLFLKEGYKDAEPWAYLVRGFSRCKIVLMVNRWNGLPNPFDLGLRDDPFERNDQRSFADLDVGKEQLGMTWLWLGNAVEAGSFRPWYWPVVFQLVRDWDRRVEDVVGALLDDPCTSVHEFLRFDEESWRWLPYKALEFLNSGDQNMPCSERGDREGPCLVDLLSAGRGWSYKHQRRVWKVLEERLESQLGDDDWERVVRSIASPIAGLLSKWLEWLVLPEQDVLVDAPHLVQRFPSLLGGEPSTEDWQSLAWRRGDGPPPPTIQRLKDRLAEHCFLPDREYWTSRPSWLWRSVKEDKGIREVADPWGDHPAVAAGEFCEDGSAFFPREASRPFEADVESPFSLRYARRFKGVDYVPLSRWLSKQDE